MVLLAWPLTVSAHSANQLPFVSIDGTDSKIYPVGASSLSDIVLPQDLAPGTYVANKNVQFALETVNLPFAPDVIPKLQFTWDFGDGQNSTELNPRHTYAKAGPMVAVLTSSNPADGVPPQLLDRILLNILPTASYKVPTSVIAVQGKKAANPYTDVLKFDFAQPLRFDSAGSTATGGISGYAWDFGDQNRASGAAITHTYDTQWSSVLVSLRVKDKQGFYTDSMVQLENPNPIVGPSPTPKTSASGSSRLGLIGLAVVAAAATWFTLGRIRK